ncbi:hypothetical protein [uncultured Kordia sp.]|uniref:hypothetical protein n=1 Tax=uncultured Kordia sp. TaxID=507699 RepID=UPI00262CE37B|nr:hypothetical protein [uncultured Kordia sp.]
MKEWFRYEYGFVNIDAENLYFTNTGNWSEVKGLKEKGIQQQNSFRQFRMKIIPFIIIVLIVFLIIFPIDSGKVKFSLIAGLVLLAISARNYLKREIGAKFKLPISKIEHITLIGEVATIVFQDGEEKSTEQILESLDRKGIQLLETLQKSTME